MKKCIIKSICTTLIAVTVTTCIFTKSNITMQKAVVYNIDNNIIEVELNSGNIYSFYGSGFKVNDKVNIAFNNDMELINCTKIN